GYGSLLSQGRRIVCGAFVLNDGPRIQFSNSDSLDTPPRSRRVFCARFAGTSRPLQSEGAGNAGRPMRPIAACANVVVERTRVSQVTPEITQHSPRNGFNGFLRALPGDRAFLPPSPLRSLLLKNLMPASGHQDHTPSPSASVPFVNGTSASTASHPASVTIAIRPSSGTRQWAYTTDLGRTASVISEIPKLGARSPEGGHRGAQTAAPTRHAAPP